MIPAHMSDLYTWRALSFTGGHGRSWATDE